MKKSYLFIFLFLLFAPSEHQVFASEKMGLDDQSDNRSKVKVSSQVDVDASGTDFKSVVIQFEDLKKEVKELKTIALAHDLLLQANPSHRRTPRVGVAVWLPSGLGLGYALWTGDIIGALGIASYGMSIGLLVLNNTYKIDDSFVPVKEKKK